MLCSFIDIEELRQTVSDANFEYNRECYIKDFGKDNYRVFYLLIKDAETLSNIDIRDVFDEQDRQVDIVKNEVISKAYEDIKKYLWYNSMDQLCDLVERIWNDI